MMRFPIEVAEWGPRDSLLRIGGQKLPYGACSGVDMQFQEEELGENARALDGGLLFFGIPDLGFRLQFTITGEGLFAPQLFTFRKWQRIEIECAVPFYMIGQVAPVDLIRPHVPGSIRYMKMIEVSPGEFRPRTVGLEGMAADPEVTLTAWRPKLLAAPESSSYSPSENSKLKSWEWSWREDRDLRDE